MAKLHFIFSGMNTGKTTNLIQVAYNYREQDLDVLILKPRIDNREGTAATIRSRIGLETPCTLFGPECDLFKLVLGRHSIDPEVEPSHDIKDGGVTHPIDENWKLKTRLGEILVPSIACVLIDEAQFMTVEQVNQLSDIVDYLGIPVMCYGLVVDFKGNGFPASSHLMTIADERRESRGICHCGKRSAHVLRVDEDGVPMKDGPQVVVGGNDMYYSVCRKHWKLGQYVKKTIK